MNDRNRMRTVFRKKASFQTLSKAFDVPKATAKVSPKSLKEDDQDSVRKAKRSPIESDLDESYTGDQIKACELTNV